MLSCPNELPILDITSWVDLSLFIKDNNQNKNHCIDLLNEEHIKCSSLWNQYMHIYGYVVITGHNISKQLLNDINNDMKTFFHQPYDVKKLYNHGKYGHPLGGYTGIGNEVVSLSCIDDDINNNSNSTINNIDNNDNNNDKKMKIDSKFDPVETFVFTSCPSNFKSSNNELSSPFENVIDYYKQMNNLLDVLHMISCHALGIEDLNYFHQFYYSNSSNNIMNRDEYNENKNGNMLRLAYYPATNELLNQSIDHHIESFNQNIRYGAHTDYQGFTILYPDKRDWYPYSLDNSEVTIQSGGLEVYHRDSKTWVQVKIPIELNALVINAGDLIQRWTNNYWHSPLHRVITSYPITNTINQPTEHIDIASTTMVESNEEENHQHKRNICISSRQSIIFFTGPLDQCIIDVLDISILQNHNDYMIKKYEPIKSIDHLLLKLNRTNDH